ncbi:unnamed protein product [Heterobilharzia americana]|nr:unnamed protein product [Heterobilharzia americana]
MDFLSTISKRINRVRVEGTVFLKMIKHYEEESVSSQNFVNGVLLGLAQGSQLEVTNCFPLPKTQDDDPNANEALINYEANMIRNLRQLNTDYLNVGFYQAGPGGVSVNRANIDNIYQRQINLSESVLLTYDPTRTSRGQIGLKAYRLSEAVLAARFEAEERLRLSGNQKGPEVPWECVSLYSLKSFVIKQFWNELFISLICFIVSYATILHASTVCLKLISCEEPDG